MRKKLNEVEEKVKKIINPDGRLEGFEIDEKRE